MMDPSSSSINCSFWVESVAREKEERKGRRERRVAKSLLRTTNSWFNHSIGFIFRLWPYNLWKCCQRIKLKKDHRGWNKSHWNPLLSSCFLSFLCKPPHPISKFKPLSCSIEGNYSWELPDFLKEHKTIRVKWIFRTKLKENSELRLK